MTILVPDGLELKVEVSEGVEFEERNEVEGLEWDAGKRRWKRGDAPVVKIRVKALEEDLASR